MDGTDFDLRQTTKLGDVINDIEGGGYDHNFCIRGPTGLKLAAKWVLVELTSMPGHE